MREYTSPTNALLDGYEVADEATREGILDLVRLGQAHKRPRWRKYAAVVNTTQYGGYLTGGRRTSQTPSPLETLIRGAAAVSIVRNARPSHGLVGAWWRKSSYGGGNDNCVEMADLQGYIAVRDSKCPGLAPALVSPTAWSRLVSAVTEGT